jgi:hypothetical protein
MRKYDGEKLKRLAKRVGISPTVLAFKAGMSASNLRKVFDGTASLEARDSVVEVLERSRKEVIQELTG